MGPKYDLSFCAGKTAWLAPELLVSMGPSPHLWFLHANQWLLDQNYKFQWVPDLTCPFVYAKQCDMYQNIKSIWVPDLICGFWMQNSHFWTRITNLYGSQTSPVFLCIQYSVISNRITCLYGSQPLSVVFAWKTATFGAELQVSMGPWYDLSFCAWKRAWLAPELLVSMGPSPLVRFFDAKQRLMD